MRARLIWFRVGAQQRHLTDERVTARIFQQVQLACVNPIIDRSTADSCYDRCLSDVEILCIFSAAFAKNEEHEKNLLTSTRMKTTGFDNPKVVGPRVRSRIALIPVEGRTRAIIGCLSYMICRFDGALRHPHTACGAQCYKYYDGELPVN